VKEEAELSGPSWEMTDGCCSSRPTAPDPASIQSTVGDVEDAPGPADILVHLVGAWKGGKEVREHSLETWDRMMTLNLRSAFL
jgi:NAD(P)-dependent dehydrogenase (short-subunit alcohol dehydrogenase family)